MPSLRLFAIVPSIGDDGDKRNSPADVDPTSMDLAQDTVDDGSMPLSQPQQSPQQHQPSSPPPPAISATLPPPPQQPQPYPQPQDMTPSQTIQSKQLPSEKPSEPRPPTAHLPGHIPSVSPQTYGASPSTPRFVGDLNPEARLLEDNDSPDKEQHVAAAKVGVWVRDRRACTKCVGAPKGCSPGTSGNIHTSNHEHSQLSMHLPAAFSDIVPVETIAALSELYFVKIHPLLPILNEGDYRQSFISGTLPAPLAHVVCLLAAKDASAESHLKLLQLGNMPVSTRQFCSHLHTSIVTSLATRVGLRRLATIRTMALLSLHHEGCDGAEQSSGYIAQAIHGAQSIALHLRPPNDDGFEMRRVFWCLYILDRFNAAMHSRPCIMFNHDIATEPITPQQSGFPAFDILFEITKILDKVIALYRPTNPESVTGLGDDFPSFSHILDASNGWELAPSVICKHTIS
ncbi:hypothetical protein NW762_014091 [Fusarium torreyae]|uniref:Xylanolytic transcriptional activator regulatory domain-containing protein n=1 Tax=Fusarium torreyae TaxID=1237075 RepID=A0A9W8V718_9HYPO|nr:hypothetical protein NW762_014091 [Fusarium torreyae]